MSNSTVDLLYKELIRAYSTAISFYLNNNPLYSAWSKHWKILQSNLEKTQLKVEQLPINDADVAYTQNKGELLCFRWRDNDHYILKDVFVYVLCHELTHQCFPSSFIGHQEPFPTLLCIITVAAFELQLFDITKIPMETVYSNGQELLSRKSIKQELLIGIDELRKANPTEEQYYHKLVSYIFHKYNKN